jgi:2-polyprenyl-3-methyl-5-hydroxy-6-metoxy-1,4-benzoquinol methylase
MMDQFSCPVCNQQSWKKISRYTYSIKDNDQSRSSEWISKLEKIFKLMKILLFAAPRRQIRSYKRLNAHQRLRREVLFVVWFPGEHQINLHSIFCSVCGFIAYTPRPTDCEISAKYKFLKKFEPDVGGQSGQNARDKEMDNIRAKKIYNKCNRFLGDQKIIVLDYGGGNGKLMKPFLDQGCECYIVDYNDNPIQGIIKIGDDINNLKTEKRFNLILCSHVLEHVSDLHALISTLRKFLLKGGIVYAEVPIEIWAGPKIETEPVTHINYFTKNSLGTLFMFNGFEILHNQQEVSNYGRTNMEACWLIARKDGLGRKCPLPIDVFPMLFPSRIDSFYKILSNIRGWMSN